MAWRMVRLHGAQVEAQRDRFERASGGAAPAGC